MEARMQYIGWALLAVAIIGIMGNLKGGGTVDDPSPQIANKRVLLWLAVGSVGGALIFTA
jgi:hypothetical protein